MEADHPFRECPGCLLGTALGVEGGAGEGLEESGLSGEQGGMRPQAERPGFRRREDFFGKYDVIESLGKGGQGWVVKVWDRELRRFLAMKRVHAHGATPEEEAALDRFVAEAQIASQLQHPGVLPIFDLGVDPDGRLYFTTEWLPDTTLEGVWREVASGNGAVWTLEGAVRLLVRVCEIVGHAHSRGVIHRDLKPSNVMVGAFGDVRVIDWGSAHAGSGHGMAGGGAGGGVATGVETDRAEAGRSVGGSPWSTRRSGQPVTTLFTPPEVLSGTAGRPGATVDVYSVGVMLYHLLTGRPPYSDAEGRLPDEAELRRRIVAGPPEPVRRLCRGVSRDLSAICERAMHPDPGRRYVSMEGMAEDLRAALEWRPVQARRPGPLLVLHRWARRHAGQVLLAGLVVVVGTAGFAVNRGLAVQRDVARRMAVANDALGRAEMASRTGRWEEALEGWAAAEAAGYRDAVRLGLRRAEAWTVLSQPDRAEAELRRLMRRTDPGERRGEVLLRVGEFELFSPGTHEQGVARVREALSIGLTGADLEFALGLLAETTPAALAHFRRVLELNPFHHGAHRHSLGLEHLLGQHEALAGHLRVFKALFPQDPTATYLEASELALFGRLAEGEALLGSVSNAVPAELLPGLRQGLRLLEMAARHYSPEARLGGDLTDPAAFEQLLESIAGMLAVRRDPGRRHALSDFRVPALPSLRLGMHRAYEAVQALLLPLWGDVEGSVATVRESWRHHPEALLPMFAGNALDGRHPREGSRSLALLRMQAGLFELAADSASVLPGLNRLARYRAAVAYLEIAEREGGDGGPAGEACRTHLGTALRAPEVSGIEGRAWFGMALALGEHDLAASALRHWEGAHPEDPAVEQARIRLDLATGAWSRALRGLDRWLIRHPEDSWATAQRGAAVLRLRELIAPASDPELSEP